MPAKSARDFQAFRVLSNEMTMRRDLERVAMRSTPCNREILTAIRHPTCRCMLLAKFFAYARSSRTCCLNRICTCGFSFFSSFRYMMSWIRLWITNWKKLL